MEEKIEYRVCEYDGIFTIQCLAYEFKGILWWRRKVWIWENTNIWGGVRCGYPIFQPISPKFKSLKAAMKKIKSWQKGYSYHYPNRNN